MTLVRTLSCAVVVGAALLSGRTGAAQTLRGSRSSVELMYARAQERDLDFMATPGEVYRALIDGSLEMLSFTEDLALDEAAFPFVLPTTRSFTDSLATEYHSACGERLVVTSGVRPLARQPRNASPKSVHPTGMAVDFRKPRDACLEWLRKSLVALEAQGVVEATEERRPAHFHVAVLRQQPAARTTSAVASSETTNPEVKTTSADGDVAAKKSDSSSNSSRSTASSKTAASAGATASAKNPKASKSAASAKPSRSAKSSKTAAVYKVRPGDNLSSIAKRHNTTPEELQKLNGLRTSRITVGQRLKLPPG